MVYPIHRRADAAHYFKLGVSGAVTSDYGYTSTDTAAATSDNWASKRISSGEKPKMPDSRSLAGAWTALNELTLGSEDKRQFITLGQLCPIAAAASQYRLTFSAAWDRLPADPSAVLSLAFCHLDDRYYEDGLSLSEGYHATMSPDGTLRLYRHGPSAPEELLGQARTPPVRAGQWATLRLDVSPQALIWRRADLPDTEQVRGARLGGAGRLPGDRPVQRRPASGAGAARVLGQLGHRSAIATDLQEGLSQR